MKDKSLLAEMGLTTVNGEIVKIPVFTPDLLKYIADHSCEPHLEMAGIREQSLVDEYGFMCTSRDQGAILYLLAKMMSVTTVLEIGCYLGHSTIAMAMALPNQGRLITIDHNSSWAAKARSSFEKAGVSDKIELIVGEALKEIPQLLSRENFQPFDLVFIDADKVNSHNYFNLVAPLIHAGSVILVDNVLWRGRINDINDQSPRAIALRELNDAASNHPEYEVVTLAVSDGMLLARKK